MAVDEFVDLAFGNVFRLLDHDVGSRNLSVSVVRNADDGHILDLGNRTNQIFQLGRRNLWIKINNF
jgi:hypothetical protein